VTRIAIGVLDVSDANLSSRTSRITEPLEQHFEHMSQHTRASGQTFLPKTSDGRSGTATQSCHTVDASLGGRPPKDDGEGWSYPTPRFERSDVEAPKPKASEISRLMAGTKSQSDQQQEKADIKRVLTPKTVSGCTTEAMRQVLEILDRCPW
jgi:hypothetical protein